MLGLPRERARECAKRACRSSGSITSCSACADIEASLAFYCERARPRARPGRRVAARARRSFPSVRIDATTIIDLFPAPPGYATERARQNMEHVCLVIEPADLDALAAQFPGFDTRRRSVRRAGSRVEPLRARSRRQHRRAEELSDVSKTRDRSVVEGAGRDVRHVREVRRRRADAVRRLDRRSTSPRTSSRAKRAPTPRSGS